MSPTHLTAFRVTPSYSVGLRIFGTSASTLLCKGWGMHIKKTRYFQYIPLPKVFGVTRWKE